MRLTSTLNHTCTTFTMCHSASSTSICPRHIALPFRLIPQSNNQSISQIPIRLRLCHLFFTLPSLPPIRLHKHAFTHVPNYQHPQQLPYHQPLTCRSSSPPKNTSRLTPSFPPPLSCLVFVRPITLPCFYSSCFVPRHPPPPSPPPSHSLSTLPHI